MWRGTTPPGARSRRASEMPRPLRPGNWAAKAGLTAALMMLVVFPGCSKPLKMKSSMVTFVGDLQW